MRNLSALAVFLLLATVVTTSRAAEPQKGDVIYEGHVLLVKHAVDEKWFVRQCSLLDRIKGMFRSSGPVGKSAQADDDRDRVRFSGRIVGNQLDDSKERFEVNSNTEDQKAILVENVSMTKIGPWWNRKVVFYADKVFDADADASDKEKEKEKGRVMESLKEKNYLIWIHGFNVKPEDHLEQCQKNKPQLKNFTLIPVIWPTAGGKRNYFLDRKKNSIQAGNALRSFSDYAGLFKRKSILAHSMGNRVFQYASKNSTFEFDNIFMCAADVNADLFNNTDGIRIVQMLNKNNTGKVHVLHNNRDYALKASMIAKKMNLFRNTTSIRLGAVGANPKELHKEVVGNVTNSDCGMWLNSSSHGYQWDNKTVDYYEEVNSDTFPDPNNNTSLGS